MLGLAQRLFIEKYGKNPWPQALPKAATWPVLDALLASHCLSYVDMALAQKILQSTAVADEASAALICHLSLAARQGHLCVTISQEQMIPAPEEIWQSEENSALCAKASPSAIENLKTLIVEGTKSIDHKYVCDVTATDEFPSLPICKRGDSYYLQRYWLLETAFIFHLTPLLGASSPHIPVDMKHVEAVVDRLLAQQQLLPQQAKAVVHGCQYPFTIITGGPGTGKTHTAGVLLRVLWEGMSQSQRERCRFALAAPTGKAAAHLEASIRRAMSGVDAFPVVQAQTLHGLLGIGSKARQRTPQVLNADVLLVDESSMIDANMMGHLMAALKPGARLIMLGDSYQLPPVESGSLFADLVSHLQVNSKYSSHVTELKICLRAELQGIIELAEKVKLKDAAGVTTLLQRNAPDAGIRYVPLTSETGPKEVQRRLMAHAYPKFPIINAIPNDPQAALDAFSRFRLLTPMRQGPFGVDALNAMFFNIAAAQAAQHACFVVPIIITANHHKLGLFNGEMGLLIKHPDGSQRDFALIATREHRHQEKQGVRKIAALLLPKYEYAYCISVHKSQGSEFDHVLLMLPEGSEYFGREALYTGITRARRCLELWCSESMVQQMMQRQVLRHSGVGARLLRTV